MDRNARERARRRVFQSKGLAVPDYIAVALKTAGITCTLSCLPVLTGKLGILEYSKTSAFSTCVARPPNPDPQMMPIFGLTEVCPRR